MPGMDIERVVADFTRRLNVLIEEHAVARAREAVMLALGGKGGRLPRGMEAIVNGKTRRKAPRQLCPVPGCKNAAAPVFGMVCAEHKDVPKAKIKQYREARRAAKLGAKAGAAKPGASNGAASGRSPARAARRPRKTGPQRSRGAKAKKPTRTPPKLVAKPPVSKPASLTPAAESAGAPISV